jgi:hypothetical protein
VASIILPDRWKRQPQGEAELDRSNPLTRNLRHLWLFSPDRNWRVDLVAGVRLANSNIINTPPVNHVTGVRTSTGFELLCALPNAIGAPITILTGHRFISGVVTFSFGASDVWTGWYKASGNTLLTSTNGATFDGSVAPTGPFIDSRPISYQAYTMSGANDLRASCNGGAVVADTSCQSPSGALNAVRFGYDFLGSNPGSADINLVAIFNRSFLNHELIEISANPWQIFKKKSRVIYFDAPSFPVLSSLGVSNITSSGGRLTANA